MILPLVGQNGSRPNVYLEMLFSNISVPSVLIFIGCCIYFNTKDWPPNYLHNFVFWKTLTASTYDPKPSILEEH